MKREGPTSSIVQNQGNWGEKTAHWIQQSLSWWCSLTRPGLVKDEARNQVRRAVGKVVWNGRQLIQRVKGKSYGKKKKKSLLVLAFALLGRNLNVFKNKNSSEKSGWIYEREAGLSYRAWSLNRLTVMVPKQRYKDWPWLEEGHFLALLLTFKKSPRSQ